MTHTTPKALIDALIAARTAGDVDGAAALYEPNATIVSEPGQVLQGDEGVRSVLEFFTNLKPTFVVDSRDILESGDLALHFSRWSLISTDGSSVELQGESVDVFRRQPDGGWLVAIDNPWGQAILS